MNIVCSRPLSWIAVVLWMALIFWLSSIPDLRSGLQPMWDLVLRKIAHAGEYAILGWLAYRACAMNRVSRNRALVFSVVLCVLYAASDEYHQTFVPGRDGNVLDTTLDSFGVTLGASIGYRL
ncbi:MAG: VanZ family protein [Candidatus Kerfeldbacteria bacterium]